MSFIETIATALPENRYSSAEILADARAWLETSPQHAELFERFSSSSQIASRYLVIRPDEVRTLGGQAARAMIFQREAGRLAVQAVERLLHETGLNARDIGGLVSSSCSLPVIPSIDTVVVNTLGFSPSVVRVPVYQHGCVGGATGLAISDHLTASLSRVVVLSVELCSLVFHSEDLTAGSLVGTALFADGAACALINRDSGRLKICDCRSVLIPESEYLMGYDIQDDGAHLRLDKELPAAVVKCARASLPAFLEKNQLSPERVNWWLFHPGGVKILDLLEEAFNIRREQARWSREVLSKFGNMSSASVFFVMNEFMNDPDVRPGDKAVLVGIGPGLTVQYLLLEVM